MKLNRRWLLAAAAVLVGNVVALLVGAPAWGLALATPAVLLLVALAVGRLDTTSSTAHPTSPAPTEGIVETEFVPVSQSTLLRGIRLPSASSDYNYLFSAKVHWISLVSVGDDDHTGLAIETLLRRARRVVADCAPSSHAPADHLTTLLAYPEMDEKRQVKVWADDVHITLPSELTDDLQRLQKVRREQETIDREYELRRDRSRYFRDEVLASPGTATAWWLAAHPEDLERCVSLYPTFSRLSAMANDRMTSFPVVADSHDLWDEALLGSDPDPDNGTVRAKSVREDQTAGAATDLDSAVEYFLDGHTPSEKLLKASYLAELETTFQRPDRAEQIRDRFDADTIPSPLVPGPPAADEDLSAPLPQPGAESPQEAAGSAEDLDEPTAAGSENELARSVDPRPQSADTRVEQDQVVPHTAQQPPSVDAFEQVASADLDRQTTSADVDQQASSAHPADAPRAQQRPTALPSADGSPSQAAPTSAWPASETPVSASSTPEYREYFPD